MSYQDKQKNNAYHKEWRDNNKDYYAGRWEQTKDHQNAVRREKCRQKKATLIEHLGGKCVRCGTTESLEFDHIDRTTKEYSIGARLYKSLDLLYIEAAKCQLLCTECHKVKTKQDRQKSNV